MTKYRLTPQARAGLLSILDYVESDFGGHVAVRVLDQIETAFKLISGSLGIGHCREDLTVDHEILFWAVGPTLIAYRLNTDSVEILFVERGEIDWARRLDTDL